MASLYAYNWSIKMLPYSPTNALNKISPLNTKWQQILEHHSKMLSFFQWLVAQQFILWGEFMPVLENLH